MTATAQGWVGAPRLARVGSLLLTVGSWYCYVRGNDQEASAIFQAGGDAGLWGVGVIVMTAALAPGCILLLLSLISPESTRSAVIAIAAGGLSLLVTGWLATSLYPPAKVSDEGFVLNADRWEGVAQLYLACLILLGLAGVVASLSGLATLRLSSKGREPAQT